MAWANFGDNTGVTRHYPGTQDTDVFYNSDDQRNYNAGNAYYILCGSYPYDPGKPSCYRGLIAFDFKSFDDAFPFAKINSATLILYGDSDS